MPKTKMGFEKTRFRADYKNQPEWVTIGGKTYYMRSKIERRWAQYLELLIQAGEIVNWEYEPQKFEFYKIRSGTVFYTPDFRVIYPGFILWHEVKGYLQNKDITKFRRMAKYYPDEKLVLVMQSLTKKNKIKVDNARKYVERVMEANKILRQVGL